MRICASETPRSAYVGRRGKEVIPRPSETAWRKDITKKERNSVRMPDGPPRALRTESLWDEYAE